MRGIRQLGAYVKLMRLLFIFLQKIRLHLGLGISVWLQVLMSLTLLLRTLIT